eukprot:290974-Rhodomonas_salina.1
MRVPVGLRSSATAALTVIMTAALWHAQTRRTGTARARAGGEGEGGEEWGVVDELAEDLGACRGLRIFLSVGPWLEVRGCRCVNWCPCRWRWHDFRAELDGAVLGFQGEAETERARKVAPGGPRCDVGGLGGQTFTSRPPLTANGHVPPQRSRPPSTFTSPLNVH